MSLVPRIAGHDADLVQTALVDGFVVYCMGDDDPRLDAISERRLPYALIDHAPDSAALTVNIDDRGAARATAEHLIALGHRRFGVVLGWDNPPHREEARRHALPRRSRAARAAGATGSRPRASTGTSVALASAPASTARPAAIAGGQLLDRADRPTAIVCISDVMALGVLAGRRRARRRRPRAALRRPASTTCPKRRAAGLTTVRQPHHEKGAAALRLLLDGSGQGVRAPPHRARPPFLHRSRSLMLSTGNTLMDAQRAFDRASRAAPPRRPDAPPAPRLHRVRAALGLRRTRPRRAAGGRGVREIPLERSPPPSSPAARSSSTTWFRPAADMTRGRWERLWIAEQRGEMLPPISVVQIGAGLRRPRRPPPRLGRPRARRGDDRRGGRRRMICSIFAYAVDPAGREAFERVYGPDGEWARFFRGARGYFGTELLAGDEYLLIHRWESEVAYDAFLDGQRDEYARRNADAASLYDGRAHHRALFSRAMYLSRPRAGRAADLVSQHRRPAEQHAGRAERLARPGPEAEAVDVVGDQPVVDADVGLDVVDHRPPGLGERVARDPVRRASRRARPARRSDPRAAGEHAPHRARLGAGQSPNTGSRKCASGA